MVAGHWLTQHRNNEKQSGRSVVLVLFGADLSLAHELIHEGQLNLVQHDISMVQPLCFRRNNQWQFSPLLAALLLTVHSL